MSDIRMLMQKAISDIEAEIAKLSPVDAMDQGINIGLSMALGKVREQIITIEQAELNAVRDDVDSAIENISVYFYASDAQDYIETQMDDAMTDAKDTVQYHLETEHDWSYDKIEEYSMLIEELVQDRVREEFAETICV